MLGLATIGQAPRDDIVLSMYGSRSRPAVLQAGALDELTLDDIRALDASPEEHVLVTRLRDGSEVTVAKERITEHVRGALNRLERAGASVICVLCTGTFPLLGEAARVLYPDQIVGAVVNSVVPLGTLGVMMPHDDQAEMMRAKWATSDRDVVLVTASPYDRAVSFGAAASELAESGAVAIVMDCMGYDRRMQNVVRSVTGAPVLLANGVVSAVLREIVDVSCVPLDEAE